MYNKPRQETIAVNTNQ